MRMKHVLVLSNEFSTLYECRREVILRLLDEGYRVTLAFPDCERKRYFVEVGCGFLPLPMDRRGTNPFKEVGAFLSCLSVLRQARPDVVLTYTIKPNLYGCLIGGLLGIPCVANITGLGSSFQRSGVLRRLLVATYRVAFRRLSMIFFQNEANRRFFIDRRLFRCPSVLLPGSGVNLREHPVVPYPREEATTSFLFVGRIMREKGISELLEAARVLHEEGLPVKVHILGMMEEPEFRTAMDDHIRRGIVRYHGAVPQEQVVGFIGRCHCVVLPSYHEGMSNALLEGAASGRPCIASDIPGCREAIDDGVTGYLVRKADAVDLAEKMRAFAMLSRDGQERMGLAGHAKMEREFDRERVVEAYVTAVNTFSKDSRK